MADLWAVLTLVGFFGLCVAFVRACDLIIGSDESSDLAIAEPPPDEPERVYEEVSAQ